MPEQTTAAELPRTNADAEVPQTLYKYLPPDRIDVLETLRFRFSAPTEFNDTFDTRYLVKRKAGTWMESEGRAP
jgi:hypothetical protein